MAGLENGKYTILGSGLTLHEDIDRVTTFDELKMIIQAALSDGTVRDELPGPRLYTILSSTTYSCNLNKSCYYTKRRDMSLTILPTGLM